MSPEVFVAGPASWNTLVRLDRLPESRSHMVRARGHHQTLGGTSAGKALNLAFLGARVTLRTLLGSDAVSASILEHLDVDGLTVVAETTEAASEQHLNLMTPAGERLSIYLELPERGSTRHAAATSAALAACDVAVIDLAEHSRPLLSEARGLRKPVWCDLHDYNGTDEFHRDFLEAADVLFLNDDAMSDPQPFMEGRVHEGTSVVVCTQGAAGAMAVTPSGVLHVPAQRVPRVVDTNGAGDAFAAGFLVAHLAGADLAACMTAGHRQAARCLQVPGIAPLH